MKISRHLGACLLTLSLITCSTAAGEELPAYQVTFDVNQGDLLKMQGENGEIFDCTAGFVDKENLKVWTAAHCAPDGSVVFDSDLNRIGVLHHRYESDSQTLVRPDQDADKELTDYFFRDISYVQLDNPDLVGTNYFSGNSTYIPSVTDEVCRYGATTETVYCAQVLEINDHLIYTPDLYGDAGDSGGPAWVPGKGYVGQAVGALNFSTNQDHDVTITVIHREDLGMVVPLNPDPAATEHYIPSVSDLEIPPAQIREPINVFGKEHASPSKFDTLLRLNEIRVNQAQEDIDRLQAQLDQAVGDTTALQTELSLAKESLLEAQLDRTRIMEEKLKAEETNLQLVEDNTALNQANTQLEKDNAEKASTIKKLDKKYAKLKSDSTIGLVITGILALVGLLAGVFGWIKPSFKLPF